MKAKAKLHFWNIPSNRVREVTAAWNTLSGMFPDRNLLLLHDADGELYRAFRLPGVPEDKVDIWTFRHLKKISDKDI